jgi:transcription antitermination factor NusG
MSNINWYALYTMPRAEKKVYSRLSDAGIIAFLPLLKTKRKWSDRIKEIEVPLISSFVFVQVEESMLTEIVGLQGICGILKYLKKPAIIRDFEIENLKILLANPDSISIVNDYTIEKGETVEVIKGPLKGLIARCEESNSKYRIIVSIEGLGANIQVNIPISFVVKR